MTDNIYGELEDMQQWAQARVTHPKEHAVATAPTEIPEGTVWVPEMGTFVDKDVAASIGMRADGPDLPHPDDQPDYSEGDELEVEHDQFDQDDNDSDPSPSEAFDMITDELGADAVESSLQAMIDGDTEAPVEALKGLGLDDQGARSLIETAVTEARGAFDDAIGSTRIDNLIYAASSTDDPLARMIVSDMVSGKLHPSKAARAFTLWYESLPDAD